MPTFLVSIVGNAFPNAPVWRLAAARDGASGEGQGRHDERLRRLAQGA